MQLVNDKLWMYHEEGTQLTAEDILVKYKQNALIQNTAGQVSYGFTPNTIWGVLAVDLNTYGVLVPNNGNNSSQDASFLPLTIEIGTAWIDDIELYFFENGERKRRVKLGDNQTHSTGLKDGRLPSVSHRFTQPDTLVVFRFASQEPLLIPIYVGTPEAAATKSSNNAYFYGALYGTLIILLVIPLTQHQHF